MENVKLMALIAVMAVMIGMSDGWAKALFLFGEACFVFVLIARLQEAK